MLTGLFLAALIGVALDRWHSPPAARASGARGRWSSAAWGMCWRGSPAKCSPSRSSTPSGRRRPRFARCLAPDVRGRPGSSPWSSGSRSIPRTAPARRASRWRFPPRGTDPEDIEAELPEATRDLLQHAVELTRTDVSEIMIPSSAIVCLPSTVTARAAAHAFRETGRSRIPLFGANRDDIVGILFAKDLLDRMIEADDPDSVVPASWSGRPSACPRPVTPTSSSKTCEGTAPRWPSCSTSTAPWRG